MGTLFVFLGSAIPDAGEASFGFLNGSVFIEPSLALGILPGRKPIAGSGPCHAKRSR